MKRIVLGGIKQETATFNPVRTHYADFDITRGADLLARMRDTRTEVAGALAVLSSRGDVEAAPTLYANAVPGGPIEESDLDRIIDELVAAIAGSSPADGACLILHGAMAGTEEQDPEGRLLSAVRKALGPVPLVASVDLHAVITDRMLEASDVLVPFHTYPHTDQYETGVRAARALLGLLDGRRRPSTARVKLPMLVRGDELLTESGLFGEATRRCVQIEGPGGALSAGVVIGNPFTDVADLRTNVIVTTVGDAHRAREQSLELAEFMWRHRERFVATLTPLREAIRRAEGARGLTVFADAADATSSGAPGDSNAILRGLVQHGYRGRALIPIVDPVAVERAFGAGAGADVALSLGGRLDPARHEPLPVHARVLRLSEDGFRYEDGTLERPFRAAVLSVQSYAILAMERPVYVVGRNVFLAHSLDPERFDLVVVKSPNGFRTHYESLASLILSVDVPGATSANLRSLPYRNCPRPMYPLDAAAAWRRDDP